MMFLGKVGRRLPTARPAAPACLAASSKIRSRKCISGFDCLKDTCPFRLLLLSFSLFLYACAATPAYIKNPDDGDAFHIDLAEIYVQKGQYDAANPLLLRALEKQPQNARVRRLRGVLLRERGLYVQAEEELQRAVTWSPNDAAAWADLGIVYDHLRRPQDAERAHQAAIKLSPNNAGYWNNLGYSRLIAGKYQDSIPALDKALSLDPQLLIAHNNLGFAYGRMGEYIKAEQLFRSIGGDAFAYANLALVYEMNGDTATAEKLRAQLKQVGLQKGEGHD